MVVLRTFIKGIHSVRIEKLVGMARPPLSRYFLSVRAYYPSSPAFEFTLFSHKRPRGVRFTGSGESCCAKGREGKHQQAVYLLCLPASCKPRRCPALAFWLYIFILSERGSP